MGKKIVSIVIAFAIVFALAGCGKDNPVSVYKKNGNEALLIVVENNDLLDSMMETGYGLFHAQIKSILADVFEMDKNNIPDTMSLTQIVDQFGEDWQIRKLVSAAQPYFSKIVSLTDAKATSKAVLDSLSEMSRNGFVIDMIFNLHGGVNWGVKSIYFYDGSYDVDAFADSIKTRSISVRSLYQTCCYGSSMIPAWEKTGIVAVNGASDLNSFAMFSPIYFLNNWTGGMTYHDAVLAAFNGEIEKLKSYQSILPIITSLLTPDVIAGSTQEFGGTDSLWLWKTQMGEFQ
jgi:hypothetical protein